jgi:hypothetical protein
MTANLAASVVDGVCSGAREVMLVSSSAGKKRKAATVCSGKGDSNGPRSGGRRSDTAIDAIATDLHSRWAALLERNGISLASAEETAAAVEGGGDMNARPSFAGGLASTLGKPALHMAPLAVPRRTLRSLPAPDNVAAVCPRISSRNGVDSSLSSASPSSFFTFSASSSSSVPDLAEDGEACQIPQAHPHLLRHLGSGATGCDGRSVAVGGGGMSVGSAAVAVAMTFASGKDIAAPARPSAFELPATEGAENGDNTDGVIALLTRECGEGVLIDERDGSGADDKGRRSTNRELLRRGGVTGQANVAEDSSSARRDGTSGEHSGEDTDSNFDDLDDEEIRSYLQPNEGAKSSPTDIIFADRARIARHESHWNLRLGSGCARIERKEHLVLGWALKVRVDFL